MKGTLAKTEEAGAIPAVTAPKHFHSIDIQLTDSRTYLHSFVCFTNFRNITTKKKNNCFPRFY